MLPPSFVSATGGEGLASARGVAHYSFFEGWGTEPYVLDPVPRYAEPSQPISCDVDGMVLHRSASLRYTVRAHPAFVERLARFDDFVVALATEHYGRAPRRLAHRGAFACRSVRARAERISEHALGNAIDFQGLDFSPMQRRVEAPVDMPKALRRSFQVRVLSHWTPRRPADDYHARFLHRLAEELRGHPEIFRGIVGPPRPRHHDHLHFDAAPWRYAMFGYESPDEAL